jgi:hypothetical protein
VRLISQKGKCLNTGGGVFQYKAEEKDFAVKVYKLKGLDEFYDVDVMDIMNEIKILSMIKDSNLNSDFINRFEGLFS